MRKLSQLNYHHHQLEKNGLVLSPPTSFFSKCNYFKIDKWWNWGQIDLYMIFFSQLEFFLWSSFHSCKSHGHWTRIMTKCILNRCQTVKFTANKRLCASVSSLSLFLRSWQQWVLAYFLKAKIPFYNIEVKISALYYSSIQLTFYLHIHKKIWWKGAKPSLYENIDL